MKNIKEISLFFKEGTSDKEYHVQMVKSDKGVVVNFQYGRVGNTLTAGTKTPTPVSEEEAEKIYGKLLKEKMGKGYKESGK
jgi:bifunctional non-homologous end joining protein LigD